MGNIFDCFTFYNELDLLEIRLQELNPVVHKFVLIEANFTHQGKSKPFYFDLNKVRFKSYEHKIIHIKLDGIPKEYFQLEDKSWFLENYQRKQIILGLKDATHGDKILISDVDEIPRKQDLENAIRENAIPLVFGLTHFAYYLNGQIIKKNLLKYFLLGLLLPSYYKKYLTKKYWLGPILVNFEPTMDIQFWRNNRTNHQLIAKILPNSGWHFSYMGGAKNIIEKLNVLNEEFDYTPYKNESDIIHKLNTGKDLFDPNGRFKRVTIDSTFPIALINNLSTYKTMI